jgi:hypothetical protein
MEEYSVAVLNELTGETMIVLVSSLSAKDAQVEALTLAFRREGWRKASAREPHSAAVEAQSA